MSTNGVYVGLDVHKDSIVIAVAREGRAAAEEWKTIPYDGVRLRKALKMLVKDGETLKVCYEAGPTGFGDLERARDDAKRAERVARHQWSKFLLRHDRHGEGTTWTRRHRDWIRSQKFAYPAQQRVLEDYLKTVEDLLWVPCSMVVSLTLTHNPTYSEERKSPWRENGSGNPCPTLEAELARRPFVDEGSPTMHQVMSVTNPRISG